MKKQLTPDEALVAIKKVAEEGKIEFAESDRADALITEIDLLLEKIGFPEAWISDLSCIADFRPEEMSREEWAATCSEKLGVIVDCGDYIVDVALRMRSKERTS